MNKENLKILADWVEAHVSQDFFDMKRYRSALNPEDGELFPVPYTDKENCGTHGCLLGYSVFVPEFQGVVAYREQEHACGQGAGNIFSDLSRELFELYSYQEEWDYLFDSGWARYDNTVEGAVGRIRHLINGGEVEFPWNRI